MIRDFRVFILELQFQDQDQKVGHVYVRVNSADNKYEPEKL